MDVRMQVAQSAAHVQQADADRRVVAQSDRLVNVPLAPELGLFLDKAFYDSYNRRWGNDREPLDLDDFGNQVADFKVRGPCSPCCFSKPSSSYRYIRCIRWSSNLTKDIYSQCPAVASFSRLLKLQ